MPNASNEHLRRVFTTICATLLLHCVVGCGNSDSAIANENETKDLNNGEANTSTGVVRGSIGKRQQSWSTVVIENDRQRYSTATFSSPMDMLTEVSIQAHVDGIAKIEDSIAIQLSEMGGQIIETGVKYFPTTTTLPYYADYDGSVSLNIETLDASDAIAHVSGTAKGTLFRVESPIAEPILSDTLEIDIRFDIQASREQ